VNETMVENHEAEERLDISDFMRFVPILDDFDFVLSHCKAIGDSI